MLFERIRAIRETKKIKQCKVALKAKMTQQAYSFFELGNSKSQNSKTLFNICEALEINISFLMSEIPITGESVEKYGNMSFEKLVEENLRLLALVSNPCPVN
ncbi:MAG: hypothetical protein JWM20_485 [Patescibacteria group bacterium]|nr:hypothetical protein [Patescibacteria group bacterium]